MDLNVILILLLLMLMFASSSKYIYVQQINGWLDAQTYCRTVYTDLAPISSQSDTSLLRKHAGNNPPWIWFGLMRNTTSKVWMWSGGGEVTTFFWELGQPDMTGYHGLLINYKWHDATYNFTQTHFLCFKVHAIRERKTWEEALEYCRMHHSDLASIASNTEMMLMKKELSKSFTTEHVWIGLHHLAEEWMWVDGQPLVYEAWGAGGKPWCPNVMCGALELIGPTQYAPGVSGGNIMASVNVVRVEDVKVWNAHSCNKRLHFLCY